MQLVAPVSGDFVVKLALGAAAVGGAWWWISKKLPAAADVPRVAGNVATDVTLWPIHKAATVVGDGLVGAVDALGMTDYLKRISTPQTQPPAPELAPGVVVINGQTFNFGY